MIWTSFQVVELDRTNCESRKRLIYMRMNAGASWEEKSALSRSLVPWHAISYSKVIFFFRFNFMPDSVKIENFRSAFFFARAKFCMTIDGRTNGWLHSRGKNRFPLNLGMFQSYAAWSFSTFTHPYTTMDSQSLAYNNWSERLRNNCATKCLVVGN